MTASGGSIEFTDNTGVNPMSLVKLIQTDPKGYKLAGANKLRFDAELPELNERQTFIEGLLQRFNEEAKGETVA